MNRLRHFLSQGGMAKRCVLFVVFTVLLSRALLSSNVMLDIEAPAGSFGLVMCSGHGPVFPIEHGPAVVEGMHMEGDPATPGMAMSAVLSTIGDTPPAAGPMDSDKDRLCPFSAVFLSVIASVAFLSLFIGFVIANRSWSVSGTSLPVRYIPHCRPRARAPPIFA